MTDKDRNAAPVRGSAHDALSVFLGKWRAEGLSFGRTDQSGANPKHDGVPWVSTPSARWHTGEFFLVQDERAHIGERLSTRSAFWGWNPTTMAISRGRSRTTDSIGIIARRSITGPGCWKAKPSVRAPCSTRMAIRRRSHGNGCATARGYRFVTGSQCA